MTYYVTSCSLSLPLSLSLTHTDTHTQRKYSFFELWFNVWIDLKVCAALFLLLPGILCCIDVIIMFYAVFFLSCVCVCVCKYLHDYFTWLCILVFDFIFLVSWELYIQEIWYWYFWLVSFFFPSHFFFLEIDRNRCATNDVKLYYSLIIFHWSSFSLLNSYLCNITTLIDVVISLEYFCLNLISFPCLHNQINE